MKANLLLTSLLLLSATFVTGAEPDAELEVAKRYIEVAAIQVQEKLKELEADLANPNQNSYVRSGRLTAAKYVQSQKERIAELKTNGVLSNQIGRLPRYRPIKAGDAGRLNGAKVLQVIDDTNVIIRMHFSSVPAQVVQKEYDQSVWLTGVSTKGVIDGPVHSFARAVVATGTKTYRTAAGGSKTITVLTAISDDKLKEAIAPFLAEQQRKAEAMERERKQKDEAIARAREANLWRKWSSADGKYTIEAKFVKFEKNQVYLEKRGGQILAIPSRKLSAEDQSYYRKLLAERR